MSTRHRPELTDVTAGKMLNWGRIMVTEFGFVAAVMAGLGFIRAPKWLRHRKLAKGFPWGYYPDKVPRRDPGFANNGNNRDFLHDTGTEFGGMEGFGDYGEFSGFGELGEYGDSFFSGDIGGF